MSAPYIHELSSNIINTSHLKIMGTEIIPQEINSLSSDIEGKVDQTDFDTEMSSIAFAIDTKQNHSVNLDTVNQNLSNTSSPTFSSLTVSNLPTIGSHLTNKTYVDAQVATKQNTLTNFATLNAIDQNLSTTSSPTFVNVSSSAAPSAGVQLCNKTYVDAQVATKQNTLTNFSYVNNIDQNLGTASSPSFVNVSSSSAPSAGVQLCNKTYVDTQVATKQNTLTNFSYVNNIDQNLGTASSPSFVNVSSSSAPSTGVQLCNKTYVDAQVSSGVIAGVGLTKSGSTLSVNASQSQITSVGNLSSLYVNGTTDSSSISTGAFQVSGGVGIAKKLFAGDTITAPMLYCTSTTNGIPTLNTRSVGTKVVIYPSLSASVVDYAIGVSAAGEMWSSVENASSKFDWYGGTTKVASLSGSGVLQILNTTESSSSTTGALQVSGGVGIAKNLYANSIQTPLFINSGSYGAPTITTRSSGTKLVLYPTISSTDVDFALGIDANTLWFSVPTSAAQYRFYGGTTEVMNLSGTGVLSVNNTTDSTSTTTGSLQVKGGLGVAKNVFAQNIECSTSNTAFVPTLSQTGLVISGSPVTSCSWYRIGAVATIVFQVSFTVTTAGTGALSLSLPTQIPLQQAQYFRAQTIILELPGSHVRITALVSSPPQTTITLLNETSLSDVILPTGGGQVLRGKLTYRCQ